MEALNRKEQKPVTWSSHQLWDHDHCEFCWTTFSERDGDLHEGYCTPANKCWICEQCFQDFKEMFRFAVLEG